MKKTIEKEIYKAIELEFCKFLSITNQNVVDAMNVAPCPLGSEKHFQNTVKAIVKVLKNKKKNKR